MATLPGTDIEILRDAERGNFKHALFDFDGTISLLREGWQHIMHPVCVEAICGEHPPTPEIEAAVTEMIDETTGIQTILQMERLVEMVRAHGLVPADQILDARGYKHIYNERLMAPVRARLAQIESGEKTREEFTLAGAREMLHALHERGLTLYIFSGTDRQDVVNEAEHLGAAQYFDEIWGALGSIEEYSKEKVLKELIAKHDLHGSEVLILGDGPVEIRNGRENGCVTIAVASDEVNGHGWNRPKAERLKNAGADIAIPDFNEWRELLDYLEIK